MAGGSLPYQDATPEMLQKQAADVAAAEHRLAVATAIAGVLLVLAVVAFVYAWKHRLPRRTDQATWPNRQA